jgi:hypothetical protein
LCFEQHDVSISYPRGEEKDHKEDQVLLEDYLEHKGTLLFSLLILIGSTHLMDIVLIMIDKLYPDDDYLGHHHCYITAIYGIIQGF